MKHFSTVLILFVLLTSCDPCDDCGTVVFEPTTRMIFINADSIAGIDSTLVEIARIDSSLNANIDSLSILADSLQVILDSIANGGTLDIERIQLEDWIVERKDDSASFAEINEGFTFSAADLIETRADINSGLVPLSELNIPEANTGLVYTDSATSWNFPLSFEKAFTLYEVTVSGEQFSIELDYENFTEVDEERNVLVRARDIQVINHSFDSLDACIENCIDGNATFTFYF